GVAAPLMALNGFGERIIAGAMIVNVAVFDETYCPAFNGSGFCATTLMEQGGCEQTFEEMSLATMFAAMCWASMKVVVYVAPLKISLVPVKKFEPSTLRVKAPLLTTRCAGM